MVTTLMYPEFTEEEREAMEQLSKQMETVADKAMSAEAVQVGGDHYRKLPIQPMRYSMKNKLDACQHTIVKYVTRFREKGGIQDLEKAKHVIDMLIEFEREENGNAGE